MPIATWGFTLEQLSPLPEDQIRDLVTARVQGLDKKQMIELLLRIETVSRKPEVAYWPDGQVKSRKDVVEDVLGKKVGSVLTAWSYYPTGEVDEIEERVLDANDVQIGLPTIIKHFLDGRWPIVLD